MLSFIEALNKEDIETAKKYVNDDMTFDGVMGSRNGSKAYFDDMEKMKLKYQIKKSFSDHNDAVLLYEMDMSGKTIFCCGWYHLKRGKISSLKVIFDPRPILEKQSKN